MKSKEIRIARKAAKAEARQAEAAAKAKQNEYLRKFTTIRGKFPIDSVSKIHPDGRIEPSFIVDDDGMSYMRFILPIQGELPDDGKLKVVETKMENGLVRAEVKLPGRCVFPGFESEGEAEEDALVDANIAQEVHKEDELVEKEEEKPTETSHTKSMDPFEVLARAHEVYKTLYEAKEKFLKRVAQMEEQQEALKCCIDREQQENFECCLDWQSLQRCGERIKQQIQMTKEQKLEFTKIQKEADEAEKDFQRFAEEYYAVLNFALDQFSLQPKVNLMNHNELLDSHMHQMNFYWTAESQCKHIGRGISDTPMSTVKFLETFTNTYNASVGFLGQKLQTVHAATTDEHSQVWKDQKEVEWIVSHFLAMGTQCILEENIIAAGQYASLACFFEQHNTKNLESTRCATMNWPKINELGVLQDEHTLVSFFRKRIHCSCLEKKYDEVKSIPKIGICLNFGDCYGGDCGKVERNVCSAAHNAAVQITVAENAKWLIGPTTKRYVSIIIS